MAAVERRHGICVSRQIHQRRSTAGIAKALHCASRHGPAIFRGFVTRIGFGRAAIVHRLDRRHLGVVLHFQRERSPTRGGHHRHRQRDQDRQYGPRE